MSDLEELLRADLHDAADTMPADLDVDDLVHRGHRLRTARTRQRCLAVVAAAVVVGVVGWAGLAQRSTNGVPTRRPHRALRTRRRPSRSKRSRAACRVRRTRCSPRSSRTASSP